MTPHQTFITPRVLQVFAASSVGLILTGQMSSWAYPAAALPQMQHPNSTIHFTPEQASWFATVTLFMSIPGPVVGAAIWERMGPRRLYLALTPVLTFCMMIMAAASSKDVQDAGMAESLLLISRVMQGLLVSVLHPVTHVYTYEICEQQLRGTLLSFTDAWVTLGYLLCYVAGCFMSWDSIALLLPPLTLVPGYIGILYSPESPLWLARKGKVEEARSILHRYRSSAQEVLDDLTIIHNNRKTKVNFSDSLRLFGKKSNLLAMITSSTIIVMKELTGFAAIAIYIVHIFDAAGVGLDPRYSSVVVGSVRLCCNGIASVLLHNFRRKTLLISGNILTGAALGTIGLFFYLQNSGYDVSWLGWLPLLGLVVHVFGSAAAISPTSWTMTVEVLPGQVRSIGFGIAMTNYSIAAFVISKSFTNLQSLVGMHGVFWCFAGGAIFCITVVVFLLPETFSLSLQDIEDYWEKK